MKKIIIILIAICATIFASGCACSNDASIYYLNFKTEQDKEWQKIARKYEEETGVKINVVTAASGNYEATLTTELDKSNAPTLFQVNGQIGYNTWKDYILDLSDSKIYQELISDDYAIIDDGKVYGIGYVYEGYGIIVNKELLNKTPYRVEDINSFQKLKEVALYITENKDTLGFSAFTSSGLDSSSSWRFSGHLANIPLYYELKAREINSQPSSLDGRYLSTYKSLWDLYINNSTVNPKELSSKTSTDSLSEFVTKKACFYQSGTWEYENVKSIGDDNLGLIPIYADIDDETQGLACGTENYWVVNRQVTSQKQQATLDFLEWLVTDDYPLSVFADEMGFVSPFKKSKDTNNVLCTIMTSYENKENTDWVFIYTPNVDVYRAELVSSLALYSSNQSNDNWLKVKEAFVDNWQREYNKQNK